jgi:proteasome activator subunit 4
MIGILEPVAACFALNDPADPRHQYITGLRNRFGHFLHKASESLQQQGEENTVDAVVMLVRSELTHKDAFAQYLEGQCRAHIYAVVRR